MTSYGTVDGVEITEEVIARMVANAEAGFPGLTPRRRVGRPAMGEGAARTVSVRLDPDLDAALQERAVTTGQNPSHVIRDALRAYLAA